MRYTARINALRHYISLLQQEEKRLKWVHNSAQAPTLQQKEAADRTLRTVTEKLHNAERELANLVEKGPAS